MRALRGVVPVSACAVPKCSRPAAVRVEWGHGHGPGGKPFVDALCKRDAERLLAHDGPRRVK